MNIGILHELNQYILLAIASYSTVVNAFFWIFCLKFKLKWLNRRNYLFDLWAFVESNYLLSLSGFWFWRKSINGSSNCAIYLSDHKKCDYWFTTIDCSLKWLRLDSFDTNNVLAHSLERHFKGLDWLSPRTNRMIHFQSSPHVCVCTFIKTTSRWWEKQTMQPPLLITSILCGNWDRNRWIWEANQCAIER